MFVSCSGVKNVKVGNIEDVNLTRFAGRSVEFEVLLPIDNPSSFRFRIVDVDLDVYINNEFIGKIGNVENVVISSISSELYSFPLKVELSNIFKGALSMFGLILERRAEVMVKGKIVVRSFPFTRKILVDERAFVRLT